MKNLNQKLHDALISYQLDLRRFEAGTVKKILGTLDEMKAELVQALSKADTLTRYNKARKTALLKELDLIVNDFYKQAQSELDSNIDGLAKAQAKHTGKILEGTIAINMEASLPSETTIARLSRDALIDGGPMDGWWKKLAADTEFKVSNAVRQGIAQGETNAQIITRVRGKRGTPGALDSASHNIAALVQTATQTVANDSRLSVFEANRDIIKEVIWFSAMDGHVCTRCIALSGRKWKNTEVHEPIGHSVPFQNPPIHWNDRCILLPVTKTFRELGVDIDEVPPGQRASRDGPVSSKTTFEDFLSRQPKAKQDEQLGAGRADLWREGKITLSQLIDGKGRELTLDELNQKYGKTEAFNSEAIKPPSKELPPAIFTDKGIDYSPNLLPQKWGAKDPGSFTNLADAYEHDLTQKEKLIDLFMDYDKKDAGVVKIPLNKIHTYQSTVNKDAVEKIAANFSMDEYEKGDKATLFLLPDGDYLLKDGNHRVNAAILAGVKALPFKLFKIE